MRYFEGQLSPELQIEINALQVDALYRAGLLPAEPDAEADTRATLSFDGMLHEARSHMRCSKRCLRDSEGPVPACPFLNSDNKHGCTTAVGRTHADGTVRLVREIPYGSQAWKERFGRRNCAERRNSILQRLGLKRMPMHGLASCQVAVLQGDFVANQSTLTRLMHGATALS